MKGKLNRLKPEELSTLDFKDLKLLLNKDLEQLQKEGDAGSNFYICTEFNVKDKKSVPVLVIGELKGEWKKYIKENVKPQHKNTAYGTCKISPDGKTLDLEINKGKAKPKAIEKALTKGSEKIIPSTIDFINFKENIIPDEEESPLKKVNEWEKTGAKKDFNDIKTFETVEAKRGFFSKMFKKDKSGYLESQDRKKIVETTNYITDRIKDFKSSTENRVEILKEILDNIDELEFLHFQIINTKFNNDYRTDDKLYKIVESYIGGVKIKLKAEYDAISKRLEAGYFAESIEEIETQAKKLLVAYNNIANLIKTDKSYSDVTSTTDQMDDLIELSDKIEEWHMKNPEHLFMNQKTDKSVLIKEDYFKKKSTLEDIEDKIFALKFDYDRLLADLRKNNIKAMLKKITDASPEEKEILKRDELFLWELSRVIPVAQINNANKILGLPPVKEVKGKALETETLKTTDIELQNAFKEFEKLAKFQDEVKYENPLKSQTIKISSGSMLYSCDYNIMNPDFQKGIIRLSKDQEFTLISKNKDGEIKIEYDDNYYYYTLKKGENIEKNSLNYKKINEKLFSTEPKKSHVLQGGLGDCYLLAALSSLTDKNPGAIKDMMLDKGDHVVVRLFEVNVDKKNKKTFKARYIKVEKSVAVDGSRDLFARNNLWVQMIEKAYAAGGFAGTYSHFTENKKNTGNETFYASMIGGTISYAMEVLTGAESKSSIISNSDSKMLKREFAQVEFLKNDKRKDNKNDKSGFMAMPWGTAEIELLKKEKNYPKSLSHKIFNGDKNHIEEWKKYLGTGWISALFEREYNDNNDGEVTFDDLQLLFEGSMFLSANKKIPSEKLNFEVASIVLYWLKNQGLFPGKKGSGYYSKLQLALFDKIKEALNNNKIVGIGSKKIDKSKSQGTGHSAGEKISEGIVGNHAYSVLDVKEEDKLKKILIRNPWGETIQVERKVSELKNAYQNILNNNDEELKNNITNSISGLSNGFAYQIEYFHAVNQKIKSLIDMPTLTHWSSRFQQAIDKDSSLKDLRNVFEMSEWHNCISEFKLMEVRVSELYKDLYAEIKDKSGKVQVVSVLHKGATKKGFINSKTSDYLDIIKSYNKIYQNIIKIIAEFPQFAAGYKRQGPIDSVADFTDKSNALVDYLETIFKADGKLHTNNIKNLVKWENKNKTVFAQLDKLSILKDDDIISETKRKDSVGGEFWLDLSDLTRRFRDVNISN